MLVEGVDPDHWWSRARAHAQRSPVPVAQVLLLDSARSVLLVQPTYKEGWILPGGVAEAGETFGDAAVRELREETTLRRGPGRELVREVVLVDEDQRMPLEVVVFEVRPLSSDEDVITPPQELRDWALVPPDQALAKIVDYERSRLERALHASE